MKNISNNERIPTGWLIFLLLLAILALAGLLANLIISLQNRSENAMILLEGSHTMGNVVENVTPHDRNRYIEYTFSTPDSELIRSRKSIPFESRDMNVGDSVEIAYDPLNPIKNMLIELGVLPSILAITINSLILFVIGAGSLIC